MIKIYKIGLLSFLGSFLILGSFSHIHAQEDNMGIIISPEKLMDGEAQFSIYDATKIREGRSSGEDTSVIKFVQDIVLGATLFIGTVVTVGLVYSGFLYIFSSIGADKTKAKKGIMYSIIGLVLVALSLVIIRLIQFLAKGY